MDPNPEPTNADTGTSGSPRHPRRFPTATFHSLARHLRRPANPTAPKQMGGRTPYWSHGPWAFLRDLSIVGTLAWGIYLLGYINTRALEVTPVDQNQERRILCSTLMLLSQFIGYPFSKCLSNFLDTPWPPSRWLFVTSALAISVTHMGACARDLLDVRCGPTSMSPTDPGYTAAAAEAYHLWITVKVPLLAVLHATCAVFLVLDCAIWLRWDMDRREEAKRSGDVEMQDGRRGAICHDGSGGGAEVFVSAGVDQGRGPEGGEEGGL